MRPATLLLAIIATLGFASDSEADEGTLCVTFRLEGDVPNRLVRGQPGLIKDDRLIVDPKSRGIKSVVVYLSTGRRDPAIKIPPQQKTKHTVLCRPNGLDRRIVLAQTGDSIQLINIDSVGHNINVPFFRNQALNVALKPKQVHAIDCAFSEPAGIAIADNIFPWSTGVVFITDHHFIDKSGTDGKIKITGLPTGVELRFLFFHEALEFNDATINGNPIPWKERRLSVKIEPGINDLGVVEVTED